MINKWLTVSMGPSSPITPAIVFFSYPPENRNILWESLSRSTFVSVLRDFKRFFSSVVYGRDRLACWDFKFLCDAKFWKTAPDLMEEIRAVNDALRTCAISNQNSKFAISYFARNDICNLSTSGSNLKFFFYSLSLFLSIFIRSRLSKFCVT